MRGQVGAGMALATFSAKCLAGSGGTMFPPLAPTSASTAEAVPPAPYFGMLTSTMDRQFLGMSPYWGVGPGRCASAR